MLLKITALTAVLVATASGCAEFKQAGTTIGHGTRDAAREIGHASRDAAKAVGAGTTRVWGKVTKDEGEKTLLFKAFIRVKIKHIMDEVDSH